MDRAHFKSPFDGAEPGASRFFAGFMTGCCLLVNLLAVGCSTRLAGVETTNGCTVVATATSIEGSAPPMSRVFIFNERYIPYIDSGVGIGTAADGEGAFQCAAPPGVYHVFIIGPTGEAASIAIQSPGSASGAVSKNGLLQHPGAVSGTIAGRLSDTLLVFLSGMCHYQLLSTTRSFLLQNVPEGTYTLKIARLSNAIAGATILHEEPVTIAPDETTAIGDVGF